MQTDHDLVQATLRGDQRAAAELWARFGPRLIALARAVLGLRRTEADGPAHDAVQSVFVKLVALDREQAAGIADWWAYLAAATRHASLNSARESSRRAKREAAVSDAKGESGGAAEPGSDGGDPDLADALEMLPPDDRELLALKHFAGLTFDQLALVLELPRGTIAGRYRSALDRLAASIGAPRREPSHV